MSVQNITVVEAGFKDLDVIATLFDLYRQFYKQTPDIQGAREFIKGRLGSADSVILLASAEREEQISPAGFIQLYPSFSSVSMRRIWVLNDLFVLGTFRGAGVGRKLLESAKDLAKKRKITRLTLTTGRDNKPAQSLYESMNWRQEDEYLSYELEV